MIHLIRPYIISFLVFISLNSLQAQDAEPYYSLDIPTLLELETSLTNFHNNEMEALLVAHAHTKSSDWKDLLPSVGIAYTTSGSPRPSANWSPLQILDRKEKDKKRKLDRSSLLLSYELLLKDRLFKLRQLYHDYQIDLQTLNTKSETISIDEKLFEITEKKYQENIIKPSEYLKEKKEMILVRSRIEEVRQELMKKKNELLYIAKWTEDIIPQYSSDSTPNHIHLTGESQPH